MAGSMTIRVTTSELDAAAAQYDSGREKCMAIVNQTKGIADSLKGSWKGEAASVYYDRLSQLVIELEKMKAVIDEQALDLRAMSKVYVKAETDAAQKAASLTPPQLSF